MDDGAGANIQRAETARIAAVDIAAAERRVVVVDAARDHVCRAGVVDSGARSAGMVVVNPRTVEHELGDSVDSAPVAACSIVIDRAVDDLERAGGVCDAGAVAAGRIFGEGATIDTKRAAGMKNAAAVASGGALCYAHAVQG